MSQIKNVLVLMCDHHRFDGLTCLGNPLAHTPNLDRLCAQSTRFENAFNQAPVCAPTRHSLASGRYVHAHGVYQNHTLPYPGMYTIAHHLKKEGFRRFQQGHMHWTDSGMDNGYEPMRSQAEAMSMLSQAAQRRYDWEKQGITRRTTGGPSPRTKEEYWGWFVAEEAIAKMEEAVANGEPFLNWVSFTEPHPPFYPPREFYTLIDQSKIELPPEAPADAIPPHQYVIDRQREWLHFTEVEARQMIAGYYGMVALDDYYVGLVLDALDRLGVRDETAIIWTADHGEQAGEHGLFTKFVMYDASVRVPFLVSLPGMRAAERAEFVEHVDVFPTICELLGLDIPESVQGRSLAPLLDADYRPAEWRDAAFSQIAHVQMVRTVDWKLVAYGGEPGELYDLRADSDEFHNLVADRSRAAVVADMLARLRAWESANSPC